MKKTLILTIATLLFFGQLAAQKLDRQKVETVYLQYPGNYIPDLTEISIKINPGNVSLDEATHFLQNTTSTTRNKLWAADQASDQLENLYFSFTGYELKESADVTVELFFDQLTIKEKKPGQTTEEYKEGEEKKVRDIFYYDLVVSFPCSLKITHQGNTILEKEIFKKNYATKIAYGGNHFGNFYSEADLKESYDKNEQVIFSIIERDAVISALMSARKELETSLMFAYHPEELQIASAKGKKFDYTELQTAQATANDAFKKYARNYDLEQLISSLAPAKQTWEKEVLTIDPDDKKARLDDKIGALLYNNLAICELYAGNLDASADWLTKADALKKSNPHINNTEALLKETRELRKNLVDLSSINDKIIPVEAAVGYKEVSNITSTNSFVSKYQKLENTLAYQQMQSTGATPTTEVVPVVTASMSTTPVVEETVIEPEVEEKVIESAAGSDVKPANIRAWAFLNDQIIGVSANQTSFSSDLGKTWSIYDHNQELNRIRKVVFVNENVAYAGSDRKGMYKTTNGGKSWTAITEPRKEYYIQNMLFLDENRGIVSNGTNEVYRTSDGGHTWERYSTPLLGNVTDIEKTDDGTICLLTTAGIWKSTDDGATWKAIKGEVKSLPRAAYFFETEEAIVVCEGYDVYRTKAGEPTYTKPYGLGLGSRAILLDVDFKDRSVGTAIGIGGTLVTEDGGETWKDYTTPVKDLRDVHYVGESVAVTSRFGLLISNDHGKTFEQVLSFE